MPQAITSPRRDESTGRITAASLGPSFVDSYQRLDDAPALHFMIVLANDPFLAANIERAENLEQSLGEVVRGGSVLVTLRRDEPSSRRA